MTRQYDEERLGVLLRVLRPPPRAGFRLRRSCPPLAAPSTRSSLVSRPTLAFRTALIADLERALAAEGYEPDRRILDEIRARLDNG